MQKWLFTPSFFFFPCSPSPLGKSRVNSCSLTETLPYLSTTGRVALPARPGIRAKVGCKWPETFVQSRAGHFALYRHRRVWVMQIWPHLLTHFPILPKQKYFATALKTILLVKWEVFWKENIQLWSPLKASTSHRSLTQPSAVRAGPGWPQHLYKASSKHVNDPREATRMSCVLKAGHTWDF